MIAPRLSASRWRGRTSRRGFTLVELMVYLALVSAGLTMFLGIELGARKSVALQQGILDVEEESRRCLEAFRRDVEAAREVLVADEELKLIRHDGRRVRYALGSRQLRDSQGQVVGEDVYPRSTALSFTREGRQIVAQLTVARRLDVEGSLTRSYRRVASPRAPQAKVGP